MGAPIQRLRHYVSYWPFVNILLARASAVGPQEALRGVALDGVPVTFKECEGVCEPTAGQIEAREQERTERFKGDQLLPIMGFGGGSPSQPS